METVSLYDKYHSQHNKNYMYNLISDIILKDHNVNVKQNAVYNQFYETNFENTFKVVDTEELTELNKHLLQTQIDYYDNFISKNTTVRNETKENAVSEVDNTMEESHEIIHSFKRNINLQNSSRHNFRIKHSLNEKQCVLEKIIIPVEDSSLFINPVFIICIDATYIEVHLRGTYTMRGREFAIYSPFYDKQFRVNTDISRFQFKNQLYSMKKYCDVYKVKSEKPGKLMVECNTNEFKENDYIKFYNFEDITLENNSITKEQYKLKYVREIDNGIFELKINKDIPIQDGLYIMNLSLQNSIHLSVV